jgi:hypothetical protein
VCVKAAAVMSVPAGVAPTAPGAAGLRVGSVAGELVPPIPARAAVPGAAFPVPLVAVEAVPADRA